MRAVIQRVSRATVTVDAGVVGRIGTGLVVFVGVGPADGPADAAVLAEKLAGLRVFADADGRMNRSVLDVGGAVLVVSQFTLYGDVRKGRRPSFVDAAEPRVAEPLIAAVAEHIAAHGIEVSTGRFGAHMDVELVNDGPVTLVLAAEDGRLV
ncbi:MAG TPA: D-aminoacyl-tRNA deacylase [Acidimicrobiia bacterium]|nr:D-aminoacyl-tRNA deacylase [Acidimicrobiia bacterium]